MTRVRGNRLILLLARFNAGRRVDKGPGEFKLICSLVTMCLMLSSCSLLMPANANYGKRSFDTMYHDQITEARGMEDLRKAGPELESAHLGITSFDGIVLLTGQVPSEAASKLAKKTIAALPNVKKVHNELEIAGPTSLIARTNDSWLTAKVKTELLASRKVSGNRIKVVTEDGVVYLMGILSHREAEAAIDVARHVYGVRKIVTAFEYID